MIDTSNKHLTEAIKSLPRTRIFDSWAHNQGSGARRGRGGARGRGGRDGAGHAEAAADEPGDGGGDRPAGDRDGAASRASSCPTPAGAAPGGSPPRTPSATTSP